MVAIGRALMAAPRLLLLDEVSLGLAPLVIEDIFERARARCARDLGTSMLLVEQNARVALGSPTTGTCSRAAGSRSRATANALRDDPAVKESYSGSGADEARRLRPAQALPGEAPMAVVAAAEARCRRRARASRRGRDPAVRGVVRARRRELRGPARAACRADRPERSRQVQHGQLLTGIYRATDRRRLDRRHGRHRMRPHRSPGSVSPARSRISRCSRG